MEVIELLKMPEKWHPSLNTPDLFIASLDKIKIDEKMLQAEYIKLRDDNNNPPMFPEFKQLIRQGYLPEVKCYTIKQPIDNSHLVVAREARIRRKNYKKEGGQHFREISMNFG